MFAEQIMGAGGVICTPLGYHNRNEEVCNKDDVLYGGEEVVKEVGRLGKRVASD